MNSSPGRLIVLEGIDGSGTTVQTKALAEQLRARGHRVVETCEPTRGSIGELIRHHLRQPQTSNEAPLDPRSLACLYAGDRIEHVMREIQPALAAGNIVISDRYLLSSLAYQGLDCDVDWIRTLNNFALPWDLCFLIDVPEDIARARREARISQNKAVFERFDASEIQLKVAQRYRQAATIFADIGPIVRIHGDRPSQDITAELLQICQAHGI